MVHYLFTGKSMMKNKQTKKTQAKQHGLISGKNNTSSEKPQAGLLGGVPEEGTVITGGDSSICVIPLKPFQWDEMWGGKH